MCRQNGTELTKDNHKAIAAKRRSRIYRMVLVICFYIVVFSLMIVFCQWLFPLVSAKCANWGLVFCTNTLQLPQWLMSGYWGLPALVFVGTLITVAVLALCALIKATLLTRRLSNVKYYVKFDGMPTFSRINTPHEKWTGTKLVVQLVDSFPHKMKPTDKGKFILMQDWKVDIAQGTKTNVIKALTIPIHFDTDFASIPVFLHSLINPLTNNIYAAVLHDYLYRNPECQVAKAISKQEADIYFYFAMRRKGVGHLMASVIYLGVYCFGRTSYRR